MVNILEGFEVKVGAFLGLVALTVEVLLVLGIFCMVKYLVGM